MDRFTAACNGAVKRYGSRSTVRIRGSLGSMSAVVTSSIGRVGGNSSAGSNHSEVSTR
jgi:hypothetical protein